MAVLMPTSVVNKKITSKRQQTANTTSLNVKPTAPQSSGSWSTDSNKVVTDYRIGTSSYTYSSWSGTEISATHAFWTRYQYISRWHYIVNISISSYLSSIGKTINDVKKIVLKYKILSLSNTSTNEYNHHIYYKTTATETDNSHGGTDIGAGSVSVGTKSVDVTAHGAVQYGYVLWVENSSGRYFTIDPDSFTVEITLNNQIYVNVNGTWKVGTPYINVDGVWKECAAYYNVDGVWKEGTA